MKHDEVFPGVTRVDVVFSCQVSGCGCDKGTPKLHGSHPLLRLMFLGPTHVCFQIASVGPRLKLQKNITFLARRILV